MSTTFFGDGAKRHLVRYGTSAEQKYLLGDFLGTYDLTVVNANMVSHTPSALAAFFGEKAGNKPFLIDPQTHAFQHDIALLQTEGQDGGTKLRKSIDKLIKAYGEPILSRVRADEVVLPQDFHDPEVVRTFAENVGRFQSDLLRSYAEDKGLMEYYDFVGVAKAVVPTGIVAPYFYMELATADHWLSVNLNLVKATADIFKGQEVYAQLVISKDILYHKDALANVAATYAELPVDAVLLWVDDFSEHSAPKPLLENYVELVQRIGRNRPVVMLYGSFFSIALMRFIPNSGLAGVCHGLEYGEDRAVVPAVGGLPVSKFYYPQIHKRVRFADAFKMARPYLQTAEEFLSRVCYCKTCKEVMLQNPNAEEAFGLYGKSHPVTFKRRFQVVTLNYPDTDTRERCVRHFMWNKDKEFGRAEDTLEGVIAHLRDAHGRYRRSLGLAEIAHCETWADILQSTYNRGL